MLNSKLVEEGDVMADEYIDGRQVIETGAAFFDDVKDNLVCD